MELEIEIKNVYGNLLIYPVNDKAELIAQLVKKKTLSENDIAILKELGYTFKVKSHSINFGDI